VPGDFHQASVFVQLLFCACAAWPEPPQQERGNNQRGALSSRSFTSTIFFSHVSRNGSTACQTPVLRNRVAADEIIAPAHGDWLDALQRVWNAWQARKGHSLGDGT